MLAHIWVVTLIKLLFSLINIHCAYLHINRFGTLFTISRINKTKLFLPYLLDHIN